MSRPARWTIVAFLLLFVWMMLVSWSSDPPQARLVSAIVSAFMLLLVLGLAAPSRFMIALRVVAGMVAVAYLGYFLMQLAALLKGDQQQFEAGRPSALMAGFGLLVFGVPAVVFALGVERVGLPRLFRSRSSPRDHHRAVIQSSREIEDVRPMSAAERELTRWMLEHSASPDAERFLAHLERAHVVSRCPCGCASVNFAVSGEADPTGGMRVLGDYVFGDEETISGAFVFEQNGVLAGLEVYGLGGDAPRTLPRPAELRPFDSTS